MIWRLLLLLYVAALIWSIYRQTKASKTKIVRLDFGDATELVEPTLRQLAREVERHSIYDLSVYLQANEEEARNIAIRLGEQIPVNLYVGNDMETEELTHRVTMKDPS